MKTPKCPNKKKIKINKTKNTKQRIQPKKVQNNQSDPG